MNQLRSLGDDLGSSVESTSADDPPRWRGGSADLKGMGHSHRPMAAAPTLPVAVQEAVDSICRRGRVAYNPQTGCITFYLSIEFQRRPESSRHP